MFPMIIKSVVWNIRGLNSTSKQKEAIQLVRDGGYSICGFIESHVVKEKLALVCSKIFGSWRWVLNIDSGSGWARVIIGWDPSSVDDMVISQSPQVIHCFIKPLKGQKCFFLSVVYANNNYVPRRYLLDDLKVFKNVGQSSPWTLLGDFNCILDPSERTAGSS